MLASPKINFVVAAVALLMSTDDIGVAKQAGRAADHSTDYRETSMVENPSETPRVASGQSSGFDAERAFGHLKAICDIGPRISGTAGMDAQQKMLTEHFQSLSANVRTQPFEVRHPVNGHPLTLANLIVRWHPQRKSRLMFCCHYDTRPFPDSDRINPQGVFIGANDGGSGVALLCELGRHMATLDGKYGIDFVFFDAEEFVYVARRDPMFLGSTWFARHYAGGKHDAKYQFAVLVDMVGDADLQIYYEGNSLGYANRLTRSIWSVADDLGVKEFIPRQRHKISDDHLPLNTIARIETCDVIDFDYPNPKAGNVYWHTQQDTVENCSAESLGKVGTVLLTWLQRIQEHS